MSSPNFRLGYWSVRIDDQVQDSIILVIKHSEAETSFRLCNRPSDEDTTGKDLYVSGTVSTLPTNQLTFIHVVFALTHVSFLRCKTWGPRVFCLMSVGYQNDNSDDEIEASRLFRRTVQEGMTAKVPGKRLRRTTLSMSLFVPEDLWCRQAKAEDQKGLLRKVD